MRTPIKTKTDKPKHPGGRPRKEINVEMVENLAALQCTDEEIAATLRISVDTIARRKADDPEFAAALEAGKARGRASLRRLQWKLAQQGNAALAIFLGKNLLGQRDRFDDDKGESMADRARDLTEAIKAMRTTEQRTDGQDERDDR